jgi:hypothetical protein
VGSGQLMTECSHARRCEIDSSCEAELRFSVILSAACCGPKLILGARYWGRVNAANWSDIHLGINLTWPDLILKNLIKRDCILDEGI